MVSRHILLGALAGLLLASSAAAEPSLVRDLFPGTEQISSYPELYASRLVVDGVFYFGANDPAHGQELWRSDGTPAGTYRLTDVCPGACDASPSGMQLYGEKIYFAASDGVSGIELWVSDGTPGNARRVRDLCPGPCNSRPQSLEGTGDRLLFIASSGSEWQLWSSDGSRQGTVAVRSFCPYAEPTDGSSPYSCAEGLFRLGDVVLFSMNGSFWRTDGTAAGTMPLDIGLPASFLLVGRLGDVFLFWAENALWQTDFTAAGTRQIRTAAELGFDPTFLSYGESIVWKGMLFWEVDWGKILRTDGTPAGTFLLDPIGDIPGLPNLLGFAPLEDRLVLEFQLPDVLWSTQGTPETTHQILELPGYAYGLAAAGNTALVCVHPLTPDGPTTLWLSDGTSEGTRPASFDTGDCSSLGYAPNVGGLAILANGVGELWGSDGTAAGTSIIHDFGEVPASGGPLSEIAWNGQLLFSARTSETDAPLFLSNGTDAGTRVVSEEAGWARGLARAGNQVFFEAFEPPTTQYPFVQSAGLWKSNGAPGGTVQVSPSISSYRSPMPEGGALFFTAAREYSYYNQPDLELFRTDGTPSHTGLVKNIDNHAADTGFHHICYSEPSTPGPGIELNGRLLFVADDGSSGRELWVSDGTAPGTRLLRDIDPRRVPGPPPASCDGRDETGLGSEPRDFVRYRNGVLFTAADGKAGRELWWTDGTAAGTRRVADLRQGAQGSEPHDLVLFRGRAWFLASAQGVGEGLWRTDGTPQGTELVKSLKIGGAPSWARSLTAAGDRLFFQVYNEATGAELWTSRGTAVSTRMVVDLRPGPAGSYPQALTAAEGLLVFAADDGVHGLEPWVSDGTAAGTRLLGDIHPGLDASSPGPFTPVAGGTVLTGANDGEHGRELWAIPVEDLESAPVARGEAPSSSPPHAYFKCRLPPAHFR
jgi:ELWxxDGT repeat protein